MSERVPELERVKRLIRAMTERTTDRGFTEAEALQAAGRVGELLEQFDLTLDEVLIGEETCVQREVYTDDMYAGGIARGITKLCSLRYYIKAGESPVTYVLFGFARDMELAIFLYETLMEACNVEWGEYSKIHGFQRKKRESFRLGFSERVSQRLTQIRAKRDADNAARVAASGCRDLVLVRDALVDDEFEKTGVRLVYARGPQASCRTSYWAGDSAGQRARINTPVNGDSRSMLD